MAELELARLHEDGEHLVLRAPDGTEHALAIDEALRAAVRRDRPRTEALRAQAATTMRPRDIQARLRAGAPAEELAAESGLPLEHVQRYEWPVAAERDHAVGQVRAHRLAGDGEVMTLGEAADTRLAARGVTADEAQWSARRDGVAPWVVEVRFSAGDRNRSARWTYDPKGRVVTPLDDEARWLGQPDDPVSPEMLGVPSVLGRSAPARRPADDGSDDATALLLDDLAGRRGRRPSGRERPAPGAPAAPAPAPAQREPHGQGGRQAPPEPVPLGLVPAPGADAIEGGGTDRDDPPPEPAGPAAGAATGRASVVDIGARRAGTAPDGSRSAHPSGIRRPAPGASASSGPETAAPVPRDDEPPGPPPTTPTAEDPPPDVADRDVPAPSAPPGPTPPGPQPSAPRSGGKAAARRAGRKGRPQVPSWDEIVFGGGRPSS